MASQSNCQPSPTPIINARDYHTTSQELGNRPPSIFRRLFGNLRAAPFTYTDELKPYSVNGLNVRKKLT